jgi:hypothetical protein
VIITLMPRTNIDIEFDSGASYDSSAVWKVGGLSSSFLSVQALTHR